MVAQSARVQLAGYHPGELEVQRRAGVQDKAHTIQGLFVTRPVSEQLQSFFGIQRLLYTATRGEHGRLWASVLFGKPSFIQIPNAYEAVIAPLMQFDGDPAQYTVGSSVATVGVMFETRRRNLINGIVASNSGGKLRLDVYQAVGNCPKYIQVRDLGTGSLGFGHYPSKPTTVIRGQSELHAEQQNFIARADTFFVATVHMASAAEVGMPAGRPLNHINHKGGYSGFVQVTACGQLSWGDYAGNNVLSTLGKVLTRTWTISSPTEQIRQRKAFTISVKKDGLVSNWLWNNMRPGKTIGFKGVDGDFTLELIGSMAHSRTLLVAGGIGITPMRVMLAEQLARRQPTTLLYSVRTLSEAPFLNEFIEAAQSNRALLTLAVSVTRPTEQDSAQIRSIDSGSGVTWYQGRITADMIAQVCPDITSCAVFQCGPSPMTQLVSAALESLQVPAMHVFQEAFNF
ncbi:hypothetical protein WJX79_005769 [Trebouxia sp. C0005]